MEELLPTQWIWASACLWVRVCVFSNLCMCTNVIVLFVNGCLLHVTAFCKMHPFLGISLMSFFFFFFPTVSMEGNRKFACCYVIWCSFLITSMHPSILYRFCASFFVFLVVPCTYFLNMYLQTCFSLPPLLCGHTVIYIYMYNVCNNACGCVHTLLLHGDTLVGAFWLCSFCPRPTRFFFFFCFCVIHMSV